MSAPVQPVVHTPGPWEPVRSLTCGHIRAAHNYNEDPRQEWTDADLRLIAAAPEMLSALQMLLGLVETNEERQGFVSHQGNVARAAISKATGKRGSDE